MFDLLDEAAVSYQIVLTKADQVKPAALDKRNRRRPPRRSQAARPRFPRCSRPPPANGAGMPNLRAAIARLLAEKGREDAVMSR